jgi:MFS family permease
VLRILETTRSGTGTLTWVVALVLFTDYLIYGAVMPLMAYAPGSSTGEAHLGLLATAYAAGVLGATPLFGWLGQRNGCRQLMILGVLLSALATILFMVAPNFAVVMIARFGQGVAAAAVWIAGLALIAEYFSGRRVEMMGYALMGSTGGAILGPLLGGWMYELGGYGLPFAVLMVLVGVETVLCVWLLPRGRPAPGSAGNLQDLLLHRAIAVPALAVVLAAAGWGILEPLLPAHLAKIGDASAGLMGTIFAAATIVYGASAPFVSWLTARISARWTIVIGMAGMAVSLPLVSFANSFWPVLIVLCVIGVFFGLLLNPTSAELGDAVERRGMTCYPLVYSIYNIAYAVGMIGTSSVAAAIAAHIGLLFTLLLVSAGMACCLPFIVKGTGGGQEA